MADSGDSTDTAESLKNRVKTLVYQFENQLVAQERENSEEEPMNCSNRGQVLHNAPCTHAHLTRALFMYDARLSNAKPRCWLRLLFLPLPSQQLSVTIFACQNNALGSIRRGRDGCVERDSASDCTRGD